MDYSPTKAALTRFGRVLMYTVIGAAIPAIIQLLSNYHFSTTLQLAVTALLIPGLTALDKYLRDTAPTS